MKRVLYDAVLKEMLPDLESPVELCDEEGRAIARIVPVLSAPRDTTVMKRMPYDGALREMLPDLESLVELCDDEGCLLARIVPVLDPAEYDLEPQINEEEWKERLANPGRLYTTAEVLAYLESLP